MDAHFIPEKRGVSRELSNLPKVTQVVIHKTRIQTRLSDAKAHIFPVSHSSE